MLELNSPGHASTDGKGEQQHRQGRTLERRLSVEE